MLIIIGEAEAAPGCGEELQAAATTVATATKTDDGCVSYGFYADVARPGVLVNVEVWRDQAALDAHMDHRHTQRFLAAVPALLAGQPTMSFYSAHPTAHPSTHPTAHTTAHPVTEAAADGAR